jgi:uncharacterized protein YoxC
MPNLDHDTLELLLIAVTAICILFQTIVLFAILVSVRKGIKSLAENVDDLRSSAMPILEHARGFLDRVTPKVEATAKKVEEAARNAAEISQTLKETAVSVGASATEIAERVNAQSSRVDAMVSSALDTLDRTVGLVADAISKPVRQLSGLLASAKAIVEALGSSGPQQAPRPRAPHPDEEPGTRSGPLL